MIKRIAQTLLATTFVALAIPAAGQLKLSVSGEPREDVTIAAFYERYGELGSYIGSAAGRNIRMSFATDLTHELQRTRSAGYDVVVGPAHVIGTAIRYGYEPVARFEGEERAVFIASEASRVTTFEQAAGKRLAVPPADSLATYLAYGELNAKGVPVKTYFKEVREYRYHEAALHALELGYADVAVVDRKLARTWLARNKGQVLLETERAPAVGLAVLSALDQKTKEQLKSAFLQPNPRLTGAVRSAGLDVTRMQAIQPEDYTYVSTLGYFTPRTLEGVSIATAEQAAELMRKGVPLYDTRAKEEYDDRHIRGAVSLPYVEKSRKEVGFDASVDRFDTGQLPRDRSAPVLLACNGPECWKSYKASVLAIKAGYRQVYWFRGGFPEWRMKGYPLDAGPSSASARDG